MRRPKYKPSYGLLIASWAFLFACQTPDAIVSLSGRTMGTTYAIKYTPSRSDHTPEQVQQQVDQLLQEINQEMSTYIQDSEISLINQNQSDDWIDLSPRLFKVVKAAKTVYLLSEGAFDVTVGPLVNLWGFGPDGTQALPEEAQIEQAKQSVGFEKILLDEESQRMKKTRSGIYLDLSAIAKGFGVDEVGDLLVGLEINSYMVDIGGEVKTKGTKKGQLWKIGIETPSDRSRTIKKILKLSDMAMATSGNYRNFFESGGKRFSHTIDPKTGHPVEHRLVSVTVLTPTSCMEADAFATALMVLGPRAGMAFANKIDVAAYFIYGTENRESMDSVEAASPRLKSLYPDSFAKMRTDIFSELPN